MKNPFTFTILRYYHDALSGECLNAGVLVYSPRAGFARSRCLTTFGRISRTFRNVDGEHFKRLMRQVESAVREVASASVKQPELFRKVPGDALSFARTVLPEDDSGLRFEGLGSGITEDLAGELDALFERYVERYSTRDARPTRSDEEVLSQFKSSLQKHSVLQYLKPKTIYTPDYEHEFPLSYRNGVWNACEAVSFDLQEESSVLEKAQRWLGRGVTLHASTETFRLVLFVGEPTSPRLSGSLTKALNILHKMPCEHEFVREVEAEEFATEVQRTIESH